MFDDNDIRRNGPKGASTFNYGAIDGMIDPETHEGKVPKKQAFREQMQERFTLAGVGEHESRESRLAKMRGQSTIKWEK